MEVIEYNADYPEGFTRHLPSSTIEKFYATPEDLAYTVANKWGEAEWPKKYKELISSGKLFTLWDAPGKKRSAYIKVDCHPVTIEVRYASDTHIYDDSTYIQSYFSDMSLKEFTELHGSKKHIEEEEPVEEEPIENRWDILDIRKK